MSEFNFYQIDANGPDESELATQVVEYTFTSVSGVGTTITSLTATPLRRAVDSKMSYFGSGNVGYKMGSDYTRTAIDFKAKDDLLDHNVLTEDAGIGSNMGGRGTTVELNPYTVSGTIHRVRNEQSFRMGMTDGRGTSINAPGFDVSDTYVTSSGVVSGKNWPSEGYRSYGGKYDFCLLYTSPSPRD